MSDNAIRVAQWAVVVLASLHARCEAEPCREKIEVLQDFLVNQRLQEMSVKIPEKHKNKGVSN